MNQRQRQPVASLQLARHSGPAVGAGKCCRKGTLHPPAQIITPRALGRGILMRRQADSV